MKLIRRPWIWLRRVRKRKGYGVHSPSAYAFLRGVVYEHSPYYAFASLNHLHPWWVRWFSLYPLTCRRLLFRLANYAHPKTILLIGECPIEAAYMAAAVPSAKIKEFTEIPSLENPDSTPDLLFITCEALAAIPPDLIPMPEGGVLIAEGIHKSTANLTAWNALRKDARTGCSYDLYTYGIAFFTPAKYPQHYCINF